MKYLIDTDWMADYLGGYGTAARLLDSVASEGLGISIITFGEIYEGIYFGNDPAGNEAIFQQVLTWVEVVMLTEDTMQRFARLRGTLRRQGRPLADPDLLIAATALEHGLTLVTRNVRHFERIAGLSVLSS